MPFQKVLPGRSGLQRPPTGRAGSQAPQPARREDGGEEPGRANRDERPDEEEGPAGVGDAAAGANTPPAHVHEGNDQNKEREEQVDDAPRSPFGEGEDQYCVQPEDHEGNGNEVGDSSLFESADDVVRQVKRREEDREQGRDGHQYVRLHVAILAVTGKLDQPACDEMRIRPDERRLHLPEELHVVAAHGQDIGPAFEVNLGGLIVLSRHMADRAQIHDHRAMDLREVFRVELFE